MRKFRISRSLAEMVFLAAILALLVAVKWPHLFLPAFWDEAWSYLPAIRAMAASGPTLLPDPAQAELTRGHPLLFYFLASSWASLTGMSFPLLRIFPLVTAALLLVVLYRFAKTNFGTLPAVAATLLMMTQALFLAQASFLLPEMLLALFTLLTLQAFLGRRRWLYAVWATLLLLTKETGIMAVVCCTLFGIASRFRRDDDSGTNGRPAHGWNLLVPFLAAGLFFVVQKVRMGWFLFPEHVGLVDLNVGAAWAKATSYFTYLAIFMGRSLLTLPALAALLYLLIRKISLRDQEKRAAFLLSVFIGGYLLLLSVNFYSPRYLLSILPLYLLLAAWLIIRATERYRVIGYAALLVAALNTGWFTLDKRSDADHNLGFADAVYVHQQAIRYCDTQGWQQMPVATHFLMEYNLTRPEAGYLPDDRYFLHVTQRVTDSTRVALITSTEEDPRFREEVLARNPKRVIRFEKNKSFGEIFLLK